MSETIYLHPEDAIIDREKDSRRAIVTDEEGNEVFRVASDWTDEQIMMAVAIGNLFYAQGVQDGKQAKVYEIRSVLAIREPS